MKFYDLEGLSKTCGMDNKYEITARIAARARWLDEKNATDNDLLTHERYLSAALLEVETRGGIVEPGENGAVLGKGAEEE